MPESHVLIDTDVFIDFLRGEQKASDLFNTLKSNQTKIAYSVITLFELLIGCKNKAETKHIQAFLNKYKQLHLSKDVSEKAIELFASYRLSHGLKIPDTLIAASAISHGIPLISKNQKDYRFIINLVLLPY
ncbi:type II toxin-antitoxin system VapC family toxin [bacterium]|nr:MAG: type II toxin-antitoxin system VapC family toxin [bacterium]